MGSSQPPFQSGMGLALGQTGMGSAMDSQKSSGLFGVENKSTSGSSPFKPSDPFSLGGLGIPSMDHSAGITKRVGCMCSYLQKGRVETGEGGERRNR